MTALVSLKPSPTLSELEAAFTDFIRVEVANGDASEDTVRNYCTQIRSWMGWCGLMRVDPAAATITDVKRFRQTLVEAGYKPSGIRGRLSIVRRFYEALRSAGLRADNPAAGVRSPRIRNAVDDFKYLSDEELTRLLSALPDAEQAEGEERIRRLRNRLLVELMALHGLRTIEVYRASVEDLTDKGVNLSLLLRGKTRDRIVYLRPDTAMKVKQYLTLRGEVPRDGTGTPLFTTLGFWGYGRKNGKDGQRLTRGSIRETIDKHLRIAGLKRAGISNHALRHTAATLGYLHTGDLRAVQELLGHSDPRTTSRYAHVVDMGTKNPAMFIPGKLK
ncbi:MAG: tyrosine-type recombinase/integrase [Acidobacteria bacterium]|nr:tyrosine-type recombinase/integrase [Acidobacteriota bacterium]